MRTQSCIGLLPALSGPGIAQMAACPALDGGLKKWEAGAV